MSPNRRLTRAATAAAAAAEAAAQSPNGENDGGAKNTHVVPSGSKTMGKRSVQQEPQRPNKRQKTGHEQKRQEQQPLQIAENAENAPAAALTPFLSNNDMANLAVNEFSAEPLPNVKSELDLNDLDAIPSCSKAIKNVPKKRGRKPGSTKKAGASASKKLPKAKKARKKRGRKPKSVSQILNDDLKKNKSLQQQQSTDAPGKTPLEKEDSKAPVSKNSKANKELVAKAPVTIKNEDLVPRSSNWNTSLVAAQTHQDEFKMATIRMPDLALCASNMELLSDVAVAISISRDATEQNDAQKSEQAIDVTIPMSVPKLDAKTEEDLNVAAKKTEATIMDLKPADKMTAIKNSNNEAEAQASANPNPLGSPFRDVAANACLHQKLTEAITAKMRSQVIDKEVGQIPQMTTNSTMSLFKPSYSTPKLDTVNDKKAADHAAKSNQKCKLKKSKAEASTMTKSEKENKHIGTTVAPKPNDARQPESPKVIWPIALNKNITIRRVAPKSNEARQPLRDFENLKTAAAAKNLPKKASDDSLSVIWPIALNKNITIRRVSPKSNEDHHLLAILNFNTAKTAAAAKNLPKKASDESQKLMWPIAGNAISNVVRVADFVSNAINSTKKIQINNVQFIKLSAISKVIPAGATDSMNNTVSPPVKIPVRDRPQNINNNRSAVARPIPRQMENLNAIEIIPEDKPVRPQKVNNQPEVARRPKRLAIEHNCAMVEVESQQVPRFAEAVSIFRYAERAPKSYSNVPLSRRTPKSASKRCIVKEFQSSKAGIYMSSTNDICSRQANYLNYMLSYLNHRRNVNPLPLTMKDVNDKKEEEKNKHQYFEEINDFFKMREASNKVNDYMNMQTELTVWMRSLLIDWMFSTTTPLQIGAATVHLAIKLVDRYLSNHVIKKEDLQMVGASALLIACKHGEYKQPSVSDIMFLGDGAYKRADLLKFELEMLMDMDFRLQIPYAYDFLNRYAAYASIRKSILFLARYVLEMSLMECALVSYPDSKRAAAALYIALRMRNGHWDTILEDFSGYKLEHFAELVPLLNAPLHRKPTKRIQTIRDKYSQKDHRAVTKVPLLDHFTLFDNNKVKWTEQFRYMQATASFPRQPNK